MGLIAPPNYVAPTGVEAYRYGLFSVAMMPDDDVRWQLGLEYEPLQGAIGQLRASECVDDYTGSVAPTEIPGAQQAIPFLVTGDYFCKSAARSLQEAEERARLHLAASEERSVEFAIATGSAGNEPSFQGATDLTPSAGPVSLIEAFSVLESALVFDRHSVGTIHIPRRLATYAKDRSLMMYVGQHMETCLGTYVVPGAGYDIANIGPDGLAPAAGEYWVYATSRPVIRRGSVFLQTDESKFLDRNTNDVFIIAQREYIVQWDQDVLAVKVSIEQTQCGCPEVE
jgi:hypothetical protein